MRADKRRHRSCLALLTVGISVIGCGPPPQKLPPPPTQSLNDPWKPAITRLVQPYLSNEIATGLVIGVIDGDREWIYGYGTAGNGPAAPTGATLFELGGVTQVYTAVLLADAIERGDVQLGAPLSTLLPLGITAPTRDGVEITVRHLITHRAGLPDMPHGLLTGPAATYSVDALYSDLVRTKLLDRPGDVFAFSNFGAGLLGVALGQKLGSTSWSAALTERVLAPLGMKDTVEVVRAGESARHAVGHADDGRVVPFATFGALAPATGLRSTATDQLAFLRANLAAAGGKTGPLAAALRRSHEVLDPGHGDQIALGWYVDSRGRRYQRGQTPGFHALIELDFDDRRAVVVLAATGTSLVDELGDAVLAVLDGETPTLPAFAPAEELMRYIGTYRIAQAADVELTITLDGVKLIGRLGGTPFRLIPVGGRFFIEAMQAFATFEGEGTPTKLVIKLPGQTVTAERVAEPAETPTPTPAPEPGPKP